MMETFAQLGIPFVLYEGPISESSDYVGITACDLCGASNQHCFRLGIGGDLIVPCPECGQDNGLDTHARKAISCRSCSAEVAFPVNAEEVRVCYSCLRDGKAALTKDTEFGIVSWEDAQEGRTGGVPGLETTEFETIEIDPDEDWVAARIPEQHLLELLRTPGFVTWQGETWLFCCGKPMTYLGEWRSFSASLHGKEARATFDKIKIEDEDSLEWIWDGVSGDSDSVCLYVFECRNCMRRRGMPDMD